MIKRNIKPKYKRKLHIMAEFGIKSRVLSIYFSKISYKFNTIKVYSINIGDFLETNKIVGVLVVEDNPADARLIKEACSGFAVKNKVDIVENGMEAMDYLYKRNNYKDVKTPNLIILDLNLPKKSGREVLKEIKEEDNLKFIPVIVLTTSSDDEDIYESYRNHANAYVIKPTDFDEFDEVICSFEDLWFNSAILPVGGKCKKD